nr:MAG: NADH-quinone oxidoreductase subunit J [Bacillota bacterium]
MTPVFLVAAALAVAGALGVILSRQPVHSVLALVLNFLGLAALYISMDAEFLGVVQLIIYAGAIMVLFLFVIGLLTARKDPVEREGSEPLPLQRPLSIAAAGALALLLGGSLLAARLGGRPGVPQGFGTVKEFGRHLLVTHVLPFELTAFVLMVAVVGVIVLVGRKQA